MDCGYFFERWCRAAEFVPNSPHSRTVVTSQGPKNFDSEGFAIFRPIRVGAPIKEAAILVF